MGHIMARWVVSGGSQIKREKICQKPRKKLAFRCLAILNANNAIAIYARECAGTYTYTVRM